MSAWQDYLKSQLAYNEETGQFFWNVSGKGRDLSKPAGWEDPRGYVWIRLGERLYLAHRLAWVYVHGVEPKALIDHIDRNPSNNRLSNLREANKSGNQINSVRRRDNTSGKTGVSPFRDRWQARITKDGKSYSKVFRQFHYAAAWYDEKAAELFGEFRPDKLN